MRRHGSVGATAVLCGLVSLWAGLVVACSTMSMPPRSRVADGRELQQIVQLGMPATDEVRAPHPTTTPGGRVARDREGDAADWKRAVLVS